MIKLATVFSGIGAVEWALKRLGKDHEIVFACDNGEIDLQVNEDEFREYIKSLPTKEAQKKAIDDLLLTSRKANFVKQTYLANYNIPEDKFKLAVDADNGMWLCENHHKLFDSGIIWFEEGKLVISQKLNTEDLMFVKQVTTIEEIEPQYINERMLAFFDIRAGLQTSVSLV